MIVALHIAAALLSQAPTEPELATVALYPMASSALTPATRSAAERALCSAFEELDSVAPQPPGESWRRLQLLERQGHRCEGEPACLAEAGRTLEVRQVAYAEVAGRDAHLYLDLRLIDVATVTELRRVQAQIAWDPITLPGELRGGMFRLLAPARYVGAMQVLAPAGALVSVDGAQRGEAPLDQPVAPLAVGEHAVGLQLEGGEVFDRMAEVRFDQLAVVDLREAPSGLGSVIHRPLQRDRARRSTSWEDGAAAPPDTLAQWPLWTSAVFALGAVGAGAAAALTWALAVDANQRALDWAIDEHGGRPPEDAPEIDARYYQPLADSQVLQSTSAALAIGAGLSATATLGLIGYSIVSAGGAADEVGEEVGEEVGGGATSTQD